LQRCGTDQGHALRRPENDFHRAGQHVTGRLPRSFDRGRASLPDDPKRIHGFMSCVPIIFARRSATLNYLLARTVNHDLFSPVLELGELCLQAPQSSLLLPNDGLPALIFLDLLIQNGHRLRAILDWEGYINFCVRKVGTDGKASNGNSIT